MGCMGKFRKTGLARWALAWGVVGAVSLVPAGMPESFGASDPTEASTTAEPSTFDPTAAGSFDAARANAQSAAFQNCSGGLQSSITQGVQDLGSLLSQNKTVSAATALSATCKGSEEGPSADSLTCENLAPGGVLSQTALKAKEAAIDAALANVQCKKLKFQAVQSQLKCLTTQADALTQQVASLSSVYQTTIQGWQTYLQQNITQPMDDNKNIDDQVLTRLNGDGPSGTKGLLAVRDGLCQALNGAACGSTSGSATADPQNSIIGQIQQIKDKEADLNNAQKSLTEAIQQRTMGLASTCFKDTPQPTLLCVPAGNPNSVPVSIEDYILCRYKQQQAQNGVSSTVPNQSADTLTQNLASTSDKGLGDLLAQILGNTPQKNTAGPNGQAPDPSTMQAATILTPADIEAQYGAQLASYNSNGFNIHDFVMSEMGYCYQYATSVVTKEESMASSPIGQQMASLKKGASDLKTTGTQTLANNASKFEEAMTALTGMNMPVDTSGCNKSTSTTTTASATTVDTSVFDSQVACLNNLQKNLQGLLNGTLANSQVNIVLTAPHPTADLSFTCQGLNGCITAYQNADRNLKAQKKTLETEKQNFVTWAKQQDLAFSKKEASQMNIQSTALNNSLKSLNSALASLGVSGGISIPKVQCEKASYDNDGLPQVPESAVNFLGCQMNPPLLDVSANDFSSALSNVADAQKELDKKTGPLNDAKNRLAALPAECQAKSASKGMDSLSQDAAQLASGNCQYLSNFCDPSNVQKLQKLADDVSGLDGVNLDASTISDISSNLNAGASACATSQATQNALNTAANSNDPSVALAAAITGQKNTPSNSCAGITNRLQRDVKVVTQSTSGTAGSANPDSSDDTTD